MPLTVGSGVVIHAQMQGDGFIVGISHIQRQTTEGSPISIAEPLTETKNETGVRGDLKFRPQGVLTMRGVLAYAF